MNKIIKNALILAAITLIAGLLLGAAHQVTLEPIQKQQEKEKQESCLSRHRIHCGGRSVER